MFVLLKAVVVMFWILSVSFWMFPIEYTYADDLFKWWGVVALVINLLFITAYQPAANSRPYDVVMLMPFGFIQALEIRSRA